MKTFLKKITVFLLLVVLVVTLIVVGSDFIIKSQSKFTVNKDVTKLILGHSHSQCSINDSILKKSINLSASGESYFYNYQKLKKIIGDNPQIQTVFIEFTNNQVDSVMDDWTWGYEKMSFYLQYYSSFMDSEDFNLLLKHNSTDLFASYSIATRKHVYRIVKGDYNLADEIGNYMYTKQSKVEELISNNNFNSSISESHSISETNIQYLRKMIKYCRGNSIEVFLIRSPQHPLYADLSNEDVYQNILKTRFDDVDLLDFNGMKFPNSNYLDLRHLNYKGANKFTTLFDNLIENNLLYSANKQFLIDEAVRNFNKK
ncbi:hypothetical protein [Winogradskyella aurantia]|uniref:DUF1574 domain-containing protein n=1 Tax=Winogradskyella aurantia TaxID=1915063 RepID=A0A265UTK3_9FLAO|nr:hypothetical protein [Winogradskyella aurantia]OZV68552.1 hypothetical protein CA834_08750 [Winogradskyella aurantia]